MNPKIPRLLAAMLGILVLSSGAAWAQPGGALAAAATGTATLTGNVSNVATGNLLEGARVGIKALGREALSDATGRYALSSLPAGSHAVMVSYAGLDPVSITVDVSAGRTVTRNFDLTTEEQAFYRGIPDQVQSRKISGTTITLGVSAGSKAMPLKNSPDP